MLFYYFVVVVVVSGDCIYMYFQQTIYQPEFEFPSKVFCHLFLFFFFQSPVDQLTEEPFYGWIPSLPAPWIPNPVCV